MIQGPVPKHGEDHEEMRRLWNEPLPPSGSDATEEGNDSDRQESRAVGDIPFCTNSALPCWSGYIYLLLLLGHPVSWFISLVTKGSGHSQL